MSIFIQCTTQQIVVKENVEGRLQIDNLYGKTVIFTGYTDNLKKRCFTLNELLSANVPGFSAARYDSTYLIGIRPSFKKLITLTVTEKHIEIFVRHKASNEFIIQSFEPNTINLNVQKLLDAENNATQSNKTKEEIKKAIKDAFIKDNVQQDKLNNKSFTTNEKIGIAIIVVLVISIIIAFIYNQEPTSEPLDRNIIR